jgi:hypothetical protein
MEGKGMANRRGPPKEHKALDTKAATEVLHTLLDEGGWLDQDIRVLALTWNRQIHFHEYLRPEVALRILQSIIIAYLQGSGFEMWQEQMVDILLQAAIWFRVVAYVEAHEEFKDARALVPDKVAACRVWLPLDVVSDDELLGLDPAKVMTGFLYQYVDGMSLPID